MDSGTLSSQPALRTRPWLFAVGVACWASGLMLILKAFIDPSERVPVVEGMWPHYAFAAFFCSLAGWPAVFLPMACYRKARMADPAHVKRKPIYMAVYLLGLGILFTGQWFQRQSIEANRIAGTSVGDPWHTALMGVALCGVGSWTLYDWRQRRSAASQGKPGKIS